ncbi:hypothetical protein PENTCL1PPCAC_17376 [Pristionchus entomophagus]|uniref:RRM domain-containing protein n=1 Tax=Pristionchus entomophagus TaxID=358040 RepID=A0AAV5TLJ8_9BILA|nr:hypothetical protein PENTCL1PPCAC_17376 [Pristionchus entomophagus]
MEDQPLESTNGLGGADVEEHGFLIPSENTEHNTDDEAMEEARSKTSDASCHESNVLLSPVRSSHTRSHESDSKRKFRVMGLKHPGDWRKHDKLQDMLARSEQFHIWFDPNPMKGVKTGGVSLTFDCPEAARLAFAEAQKFVLDGKPVKVQASKAFYEPPRRPLQTFSVSDNSEMRDRTLYAVYLLESTSVTVLESIFGEDLEKVEILPLADKRNQAEVIMKTTESAKAAKEDVDGFDLNDGENNSVMKVFSPSEYEEFISRGSRPYLLSPTPSTSSLVPPLSRSNSNASTSSKPALSPAKTHQKEVEKTIKSVPPPAVSQPLPTEIPEFEPSLDEVAASMRETIETERINWAEMTEREELYALADKVSYKLGGVRDELLRDSLLCVMETSREEAEESSWMRRHLDGLIKLWKKEISCGIPFDRPSRVPLQSRVINPIPKEKKRKRGGGAALRAQFGMGAVLAAARAKFATEEGELDIEEADDGSILIGDVPLSFESWARFNKQPLKRAAPKEDYNSEKKEKENRRVKRAKMEEEKKKRKDEEKAKKEAEKPQKELEEGEMDSDDSEGEKKAASSSSSSSDSDEEGDSRRRRRFRRKNDRTKPPSLPPLFQSIYDNRVSIISQLSVEHRVAFSKVLTQFVNQKGGIDSNQEKALMSYMSNFGR